MDKEKIIQQIVAAMAILEKCSDQEVEDTKKFLRWMSDDALQDMWSKHMKALEQRTPALIKK